MMTTAVSYWSHYRCHGVMGISDLSVLAGDADNGSELFEAFPEKLVWRYVDDDNSSELYNLITIVMSGNPAMTTVVTALLNTVVIKLNRVQGGRVPGRHLTARRNASWRDCSFSGF